MKKSAAVALRYVAGFALVFLTTTIALANRAHTWRDLWVAAVAALPLAVDKWIQHPN